MLQFSSNAEDGETVPYSSSQRSIAIPSTPSFTLVSSFSVARVPGI